MGNENSISPVSPTLEYFITLRVDVGTPAAMGATANGERKMIPITGGSVSGQLNGKILAGGSDAIVIRPDGCAVLNARYVLVLDNGSLIYVEDRGYRHGPEFVMARLSQAQSVDPSQYYFRTCMTMETADQDYAWITKNLFIGSGCRQEQQVQIDLFQVK